MWISLIFARIVSGKADSRHASRIAALIIAMTVQITSEFSPA